VGTTTSHSFFLAGSLDSGHHCSRDTLRLGDGSKHDYQAAQTVLEMTLTEEYAKINELTGKICLPGDLVARAADKSIRDSIMGTMVLQYKTCTCPQGLTQLFRGLIKIYSNDTANFVDALQVLWWIRFDPEHITDYIRMQSELSFLHVKSSISQKDKLRQVRLAICETCRQVAATRLESIAGCDNPYSLIQVFGRGHLASKAGATVYVTRCRPVSMTPRAVVNCTAEIPASNNRSKVYIDPISYVIKSYGTPIKCTDIAPPRFQIGGRWYCLIAQRGLSECHQPLALPIAAVEIVHEEPEPWGLGRSSYSEAQLAAFAEFQQAAAVRAAYVADVSELAYSRRGPDGEWGLPLGPRATEAIIDHVGLSFVPLYRFLGPVSMIVILVLFFVGINRLVFTILFRAIVLGGTRGFWIFAAFLGCAYQLLISPIQWADRKAQEIAARVERGMLDGAEDEAKSAKEVPALLSTYPSLTEVRQNERFNFCA
jgi:hypothetical protein